MKSQTNYVLQCFVINFFHVCLSLALFFCSFCLIECNFIFKVLCVVMVFLCLLLVLIYSGDKVNNCSVVIMAAL